MSSSRLASYVVLCACLLLVACNGGRRGGRPGVPFDSGGGTSDGGTGGDGAVETDAGPTCDLDCSHLDGDCVVGHCDGLTGECIARPLGEGAVCDDGDPCTDGDACAGGTCVAGGPTDCSALDTGCTVGMCDAEEGGCVGVPVSEGSLCDDGDPCTTGESCSAGACIDGSLLDCSHLDGQCATGECNPSTGSCRAVPLADSTLCDDGNGCTTLDRCSSGVCTAGTARDCSAFTDDCNVGMCDALSGTCGAVPVTDGTFCNDGDSCTVGDSCSAGVCTGTNTCCSVDDFRITEVYGDSPDYIEITNTGTCALDIAGLQLRWYLGCDTAAQTYTLPSRMIPAGETFRIVDSSTGVMANELYMGGNICHTYYEQGWVALCNGACSSTCSNYLDYVEMAGSGTLPMSRPTCATFTPSPLAMGSATYTQSATRIGYTGSGAAGRQSDWAMRSYSRTP